MSDKNKQALGALAMDLKRVALFYHRGSDKTAERFFQEALERKNEVETKTLKPYLVNCLQNVSRLRRGKDKSKIAEDALMYSTLFQNAAISK
ncbi:MAG: hypothetical protein AAB801_02915 [Patescibacteria group bacterium]